MSIDARTIQDPAPEEEQQKIRVMIQSTVALNQEIAAKVQGVLDETMLKISALVNAA